MAKDEEVTIAAELRRLRGELTLRQHARRASCSKSLIGDLEHRRRTPTPPIALARDNAPGADGTLVFLAEAQRGKSKEAPKAAPDSAADGLLREWDDVWRREFLKSACAASAALATGLSIEGIADQLHGVGHADDRSARVAAGRTS